MLLCRIQNDEETLSMRIGFDAKRAFLNRTGLGNYSRNIILQLDEFFPDTELVLFSPDTKESLFTPPANSKVVKPHGIHSLSGDIWRNRWMVSDIRKHNPDIYHGLSHELPRGIEQLHLKKVVTIHDLIFLRYPEFYKPIDRMIYRQKFSRACRAADRVLAISTQTKSDLIEYFKVPASKIEVVYQSCNPQFFQPVSEDDKARCRRAYQLPDSFMLTVGNVDTRKNLAGILKAMVLGKIELPLVVIGKPGTAWQEVNTLLKANPNLPVILLPGIDYRDLASFYHLALFSIYPSFFEGFGLPVLESMACGCPVITSLVSSMPEAGGPAARYIEPSSPEDIAAAIQTLISHPEIREQMTSDGYRQAELFSPGSCAQNIMKFYLSL